MTAVGMEENETALRIPNAAENEKKLENEILMVPNVSDDVLAVSGTITRIINEDLDFELAQKPGRGKTGELRGVAARYLAADRVHVKEKSNIVDRGRSELSVANGMRPIIDRVPASGVFKHASDDLLAGGVSGGVWLCYGFGKYGTMVASGAAKILVSKMFGKRSETVSAGDSFHLPGYVQSQAKGKGKGKGKAW
jgi:glycine/D-amino acid oxidase-like deaminating enzyme